MLLKKEYIMLLANHTEPTNEIEKVLNGEQDGGLRQGKYFVETTPGATQLEAESEVNAALGARFGEKSHRIAYWFGLVREGSTYAPSPEDFAAGAVLEKTAG